MPSSRHFGFCENKQQQKAEQLRLSWVQFSMRSLCRACEASWLPCSFAVFKRFCPTTLAWSPTAWTVVVKADPILLKAFFKSSRKFAWLPAAKHKTNTSAIFISLKHINIDETFENQRANHTSSEFGFIFNPSPHSPMQCIYWEMEIRKNIELPVYPYTQKSKTNLHSGEMKIWNK